MQDKLVSPARGPCVCCEKLCINAIIIERKHTKLFNVHNRTLKISMRSKKYSMFYCLDIDYTVHINKKNKATKKEEAK